MRVLGIETSCDETAVAVVEAAAGPQQRRDITRAVDDRRLDTHLAGSAIDGQVVRGQSIAQVGERVRDVAVGPDGAVWAITDETNGKLVRLARVRVSIRSLQLSSR